MLGLARKLRALSYTDAVDSEAGVLAAIAFVERAKLPVLSADERAALSAGDAATLAVLVERLRSPHSGAQPLLEWMATRALTSEYSASADALNHAAEVFVRNSDAAALSASLDAGIDYDDAALQASIAALARALHLPPNPDARVVLRVCLELVTNKLGAAAAASAVADTSSTATDDNGSAAAAAAAAASSLSLSAAAAASDAPTPMDVGQPDPTTTTGSTGHSGGGGGGGGVSGLLPPSASGVQLAPELDPEAFPLGFRVADPLVHKAALVLRMLYIGDLRATQTRINELIVAVQNLTADPKTDHKLGKVGR